MDHQILNREAIENLLSLARAEIAQWNGRPLEQVLVVQTGSGKIHRFSTTMEDYVQMEQAVLRQLADDPLISCMVAMWKNGDIDLPSMSLREKLVELEPGNADAVMPVLGDEGLSLMTLGRTLK